MARFARKQRQKTFTKIYPFSLFRILLSCSNINILPSCKTTLNLLLALQNLAILYHTSMSKLNDILFYLVQIKLAGSNIVNIVQIYDLYLFKFLGYLIERYTLYRAKHFILLFPTHNSYNYFLQTLAFCGKGHIIKEMYVILKHNQTQ